MREIKFRGKDLLGKWRYGDLVIEQWKSLVSEKAIMIKKDKRAWTVQGETVGQYTGLKDKNGKEIYEGDIVKLFLFNEYTTGYIKYNEEKGRFDIGWISEVEKYKNNGFVGSCSCMTNDYDLLEVIGNIYEDGGLLNEN